MRWNMNRPLKTYDEQIERLLSGGLAIENLDKTEIFLSQVNYYNLINGHKTLFLKVFTC